MDIGIFLHPEVQKYIRYNGHSLSLILRPWKGNFGHRDSLLTKQNRPICLPNF